MAFDKAVNGVKEAAVFAGQKEAHNHPWTGDWDGVTESVKQTAVFFDDRIEMRLHVFADTFVINKERQDYNNNGFVGWLVDIFVFDGKRHYITMWSWPEEQIFPLHYHEWVEIHTVIKGHLSYSIDNREYRLGPGYSRPIGPNVVHGAIARESSVISLVIIEP